MPIQRLSNAGQSGYRYKSLIAGITPVASIPTIGAATALTSSTASVAFTAPGAYAATTYTATSSPGGLTGTSATSPITVSGLSEQTAYTFTVTATNASGTSSPSAASSSITTPVAFAPESGYDSLAAVTLSASASSITFAGIPSGYKHLQIRALARTDRAGNYASNMNLQFNTDTANNYADHDVNGNGSNAQAEAGTTKNNIAMQRITGASAASSIFGVVVADILDYTNTNKYKTVRWLGGFDNNSTQGEIYFGSGLWQSTSAVSTITLQSVSGAVNFTQYSSFALYGVK